jgi:Ca-activated chloride channel family protein
MNNLIKLIMVVYLALTSCAAFAWQWSDLWHTSDQQGQELLQKGKPKEAAYVFANKDWQAVAQYRAGEYAQAYEQFGSNKTSDAQYNAGNAAAYQGKYAESVKAYDKAIALNPNNEDAIANRDIVKKLQAKQEQQDKKSSEKDSEDKKQEASSKDQKNSSAKNKEDKPNEQKDAAAKNKDDKQSGQNKDDKQQDAQKDQSKEQNTNSQQAKSEKSQPKPDSDKIDGSQPPNEALATSQQQNQDEDKKQMLRRLADDPGGLLRQKFMRDYYRRHPGSEYLEPGDDN